MGCLPLSSFGLDDTGVGETGVLPSVSVDKGVAFSGARPAFFPIFFVSAMYASSAVVFEHRAIGDYPLTSGEPLLYFS